MRRALLLAALAGPAVATAQSTLTEGVITFTEGTNDVIHGQWISKAECENASATVNLSWIISPQASFPANGTYQLYASDTQPTNNTCFIKDSSGTPTVKADPISDTIANQTSVVQLLPMSIAKIFTAVKITDCSTVTGDTPIYVCAQAHDSGTNNVGFAVGKITLSLSAPGAPSGVTATPADDGALTISWTRPTTGAAVTDYRITAAADPPDVRDTTTHEKTNVTSQSFIMSGLVNEVPYKILVYARSQAGNESDPAQGTGTPVAVANFWDAYQAAGGREQGGCAAGAAGPVALLGVAALLARLRRRS